MKKKEKFGNVNADSFEFSGKIADVFAFVEEKQLLREDLWKKFVYQFKIDSDFDCGWRGEYWGKMMRGASLVYAYTKNEKLYEILADTVRDMIASADEDGRISSYGKDHEFDGWDLWCRKYVLLGMQYFLEICLDESLREDVIASMKRQSDYIMAHIGNGNGKTPITAATRNWNGLNSSSILEPIVRLYNLTGEKKYFDFAEYIISCGGIDNGNIFELAYEDKLFPYQYPVTKAYEMISCFEGLLEFYKICGIEKYRTAIENFASRLFESDFTVIGSCGCTHELFDNSTITQHKAKSDFEMQETCVTVTVMKFFSRVYLLTGDVKLADAFETSLYNAYLGALNTEDKLGTWQEKYSEFLPIDEMIQNPLPFDSYSPLTQGTRGIGVGGIKMMTDKTYYGCCACIGSAGIGLVPRMYCAKTDKGFALNMYIDGKAELLLPSGEACSLKTETEYPKSGSVRIKFSMKKAEEFELLLRNPSWSRKTSVTINGEGVSVNAGYISICRLWEDGDIIEIEFSMDTVAIFPKTTTDKENVVLCRGPLVLSRDARLLGDVDEAVDIKINEDGSVPTTLCEKTVYPCIVQAEVSLKNGESMLMTDYSSAGKLWSNESRMATWLTLK